MPSTWQTLLLVLCFCSPGSTPIFGQTVAPDTPPADQEVYYPSTHRSGDGQKQVDLSVWVQVMAILALAGAGLWVLAAKKGFTIGGKTLGTGAGSNLQILETRALGQRQYLMIVSADGQRLLLAAGPQGITLLKRLDEPDFPAALEDATDEEGLS